jgi:hypothetical protein
MHNILILIGLFLNFVGIIFLLWFYIKTKGTTTHADVEHLGVRWMQWWGYSFLGGGFLFHIVANSLR